MPATRTSSASSPTALPASCRHRRRVGSAGRSPRCAPGRRSGRRASRYAPSSSPSPTADRLSDGVVDPLWHPARHARDHGSAASPLGVGDGGASRPDGVAGRQPLRGARRDAAVARRCPAPPLTRSPHLGQPGAVLRAGGSPRRRRDRGHPAAALAIRGRPAPHRRNGHGRCLRARAERLPHPDGEPTPPHGCRAADRRRQAPARVHLASRERRTARGAHRRIGDIDPPRATRSSRPAPRARRRAGSRGSASLQQRIVRGTACGPSSGSSRTPRRCRRTIGRLRPLTAPVTRWHQESPERLRPAVDLTGSRSYRG
jgi:hypothetical protein